MVGREGGEREGKEGKGWLRGTKRKYLKGYSGGQTAGGVGGQNFLGFGASLYLTFSLSPPMSSLKPFLGPCLSVVCLTVGLSHLCTIYHRICGPFWPCYFWGILNNRSLTDWRHLLSIMLLQFLDAEHLFNYSTLTLLSTHGRTFHRCHFYSGWKRSVIFIHLLSY